MAAAAIRQDCPLAESCIGSTSGNKEKETELTLRELNFANSGSRCGQMGTPTSSDGSVQGGQRPGKTL